MDARLIDEIGDWLASFAEVLSRWELTLRAAEVAYLSSDIESIEQHTHVGESIHEELAEHKRWREELLARAQQLGLPARHFRDLSRLLGDACPSHWTKRIPELELQLNRVQQLSVSLWMSALHSHSTVTSMLMILATGRRETATYDPNESRSHEGGFLVNEAA
jgi:hypothetical protein